MNSNIKNYNKKSMVVRKLFATVIFASGIVLANAQTYAAMPTAGDNRFTARAGESTTRENNRDREKNNSRRDLLTVQAVLEGAKKNPVPHIAGLDVQSQTYLQRAYVRYKKRIENGSQPEYALEQYVFALDAIIRVENFKSRGFFYSYIIDPVVAGGKLVVSYAMAPFVNMYQGLKKRDKKELMRGLAGLGAYAACYAAYYGLYIPAKLAHEIAKERSRQTAQAEADRRRAERDERNARRADRHAVGVGSDECPTCMVEEENEFIRFHCNHGMCRGCLTGQNGPIAIAVRERDYTNLRCPVVGCRAAWGYDIAHDLSAELIFGKGFDQGEQRLGGPQESLGSRFIALGEQFQREDTPGYTKCPQDGCQWSTILANEDRQDVQCQTCQHNYCSECKRESHGAMTCARARRLAAMSNPVKLPDGIKQCPRCQMGVERSSGCNHMACGTHTYAAATGQGCGYEFCWVCLAPWANEHYYCPAQVNRAADYQYFRPAPPRRPAVPRRPAAADYRYFRPAPQRDDYWRQAF